MVVRSSPRTWGCFLVLPLGHEPAGVFPTHVGVFHAAIGATTMLLSLPHARGGVSTCIQLVPEVGMSSPRTWGCFSNQMSLISFEVVFPTHVGVFLEEGPAICAGCGLPHARGGVSLVKGKIRGMLASSPRTWGCFQILLHVGGWGRSLPHARGGVSSN